MAKKQSFGDKSKKKEQDKNPGTMVKVVESVVNPRTGAQSFRTRMIRVTKDNEKEIYG